MKGSVARRGTAVSASSSAPTPAPGQASFSNAALMFVSETAGITVMAGLLLVSTKEVWRSFTVQGQGTSKLLGTIYLPKGALWVSRPGDLWPDLNASPDVDTVPAGAPSTVGAASAYTVLVVRRLIVTGGMKLVVNADYASTSVPVPVGLGPGGGTIGLSR